MIDVSCGDVEFDHEIRGSEKVGVEPVNRLVEESA